MFKYVKKLYAKENDEIRQKALNLSILLLLLLTILLITLIFDLVTWDEKNLPAEVLSYSLVVFSAYHFIKVRYSLASLFSILAMIITLEVSLFSSISLSPERIFMAAAYMLTIQIIVLFVNYKSFYLLISGAIGIVTIVVLFFQLNTLIDNQNQKTLLNAFIVSLGIFTGAYVVCYSISRSYSRMLKETREEAEKTAERLIKITTIVATSEQAIENTKDMENHFSHAFKALQNLVIELQSFRDRLNGLDQNLDSSNQSISRITDTVQKFNQLVSEQSAAIEEASASVHQMVASLESVHQITQQRLASTKMLASTSKQGNQHLELTNKAFTSVNLAMEKIIDVNSLIQNIADKTNLLGMNASIEAAHAGEKGKGFAVVAGEIRKLAESAASNSKLINNHIQVLIKSFQEAEKNIESTTTIYTNVFHETSRLTESLSEIEDSTTQLNMGGSQILGGISIINESSTTIHRESHDIEENQKQIQYSVTETKELSSHLRKTLDKSIMAILDIEAVMKTIKSSILNNQEITQRMHDSVNTLKSAQATGAFITKKEQIEQPETIETLEPEEETRIKLKED
ncbi:MAG: hypothetical protein JXR70_09905 [Spirochaetales bacterium]|nr:hypothetical protein [Spirochaetales bacterium]